MEESEAASTFLEEIPEGYRLDPDGVLEIGALDRPVEIPRWYRQWCERNLKRLVVRSNGKPITRSPNGLILTPAERASPLAPYHHFDDDDILTFSGIPPMRALWNHLRAIFRVLAAPMQSPVAYEVENLSIPWWYEMACYRQGSSWVTYSVRGKRWVRHIEYDL